MAVAPGPVLSPPLAVAADWTTYQHDAARTGTAADHIGPSLRRAWARTDLDGAVYAQPLLVGDAVIVATEGDSVYRVDAGTGSVVWRAHFGDPVPGGELPCGDIDPVGITGTPVVDPHAGLVWAVAFVEPHRHDLVAVDLSSGAVRARRPVDPPGADPSVLNQRAALTLANGHVYVAFGGLYGDCGRYHGWVVASPASLAAANPPLTSWQVPTGREGGIWAPPGAAVDGAGNLYVATGNSAGTSTYDFGNSVVRLTPELRPLGSFAPLDWADLNRGDTDLGSVGPTLVGSGLVFQVGKAGEGYLVATDHLGGVGGAVYQAAVCRGAGAYGGTAFFDPLVIVPCASGIVAVRISGRTFSIAWRGPPADAGPPVITQGTVWSVDIGRGDLVGLDLTTGRRLARVHVGSVPHFAPLAAGGGRLVLATGNGAVALAG